MLIAGGIIMLIAEKVYKFRDMEDTGIRDAIFIGIAQALAIIPGYPVRDHYFDRPFQGHRREASARFSFLLSTPIIAGATVLHFKKAFFDHGTHDFQLFAAGFSFRLLPGIIAIKFLLAFLKKYPLNLFVYYRFALAAVIIAGIWLKR